jgi:hypothetical protein
MKHYSNTEARKNFSKIIKDVHYKKMIVSIGKHGAEEVLVIPKPVLDENLPISQMNASSPSFDFLNDEPDLYSLSDLTKQYV